MRRLWLRRKKGLEELKVKGYGLGEGKVKV